MNFRHQARKYFTKVVFLVILACETWMLMNVIIISNRFCYVPNEEFKRETCVCDGFHISHFRVCCWVVDIRGCVFSAVLSNSCQKTTMADFRYKSIKSWKIDNIDLTQQFSLSIFTDFRYQSIKITWLLPSFYRYRFLPI